MVPYLGITTLTEYDNGGVALYLNQNGQLVSVAEDSRYTENMLNTYGTEWVNRVGVLEGGWTLGATIRAFADWIGLDGTFGLDGGFANDGEGSAAAGSGAGGAGGNTGAGASDRDDDDRSDRVVVITGGVRGGNKVVTNGGTKDRTALEDRRPILRPRRQWRSDHRTGPLDGVHGCVGLGAEASDGLGWHWRRGAVL